MNKLKAGLIAIALLAAGSLAYSDQIPNMDVPNGMQYKVVLGSGQVVTSGGTLYALYLGTGSVGNWCQPLDTQGVLVSNAYSSFSSSAAITPYVQYSSAPLIGGVTGNYVNFQPYGVMFSTGLYIFNNAGGNQCGVYYKR